MAPFPLSDSSQVLCQCILSWESIGPRGTQLTASSQQRAARGQKKGDKSKKKEKGDFSVGAAFPDLPVPGVIPGSLSNGSNGSRDLAV